MSWPYWIHRGIGEAERNGELDAVLEISPLYATSARDLQARRASIGVIERGGSLYFGANGRE